jgi:hypothetical protein
MAPDVTVLDLDAFIRVVQRIAEEYHSGASDWPQITTKLKEGIEKSGAGIRERDALALLIGLRTTENQKDDPDRDEKVTHARELSFVNFKKGRAAKAKARMKPRALSERSFDLIQSYLVYGFLLKRRIQERRKPLASRKDFRGLAPAMAMILTVKRGRGRPSDAEILYHNFRQRVGRLHRVSNPNLTIPALSLFNSVYATVFRKS